MKTVTVDTGPALAAELNQLKAEMRADGVPSDAAVLMLRAFSCGFNCGAAAAAEALASALGMEPADVPTLDN